MKTQYATFTEFAQEIDRIEQAKMDLIVPTKSMAMVGVNSMLIGDSLAPYDITDVAHAQIANKLGIPKKYYDIMPLIPDLREHNVNAWLHESDTNYLTRTLDGNIRALLSDRFKPMDNYMVLQSLLPVLNDLKDFQIVSDNLSETKMYLQIIFPSMEAAISVNDVVQWGIVISNSEVGHGAVNIETLIFRLKCKNGMIGSSVLKRNHIGSRIGVNEEDYNLYEDDTIQADMHSFQLKMRDTVKNAASEITFHKEINLIKEAAGQIIEKPETVIKNVTKHFNMNENLSEMILSNMIQSKDMSRWGLANGITFLAHDMENSDHQYEIEKIGNKIIHLDRSQWEVLSA